MSFRRASLVMLASAAFAVAPMTAKAAILNYFASLDGSSALPANASPGTGSATLTIDTDLFTMRVVASFSDLFGNATAAHVHCCDFQLSGAAGVATQAPTFAGFPVGVTSGSYDNTFDMTLISSYRLQFLTANGGSVFNAFQSLLNGLDSGLVYFDIHTSAFPGGEIRGIFALDVNPVPVPAALPLFATILAGGGLIAWRRKRKVMANA